MERGKGKGSRIMAYLTCGTPSNWNKCTRAQSEVYQGTTPDNTVGYGLWAMALTRGTAFLQVKYRKAILILHSSFSFFTLLSHSLLFFVRREDEYVTTVALSPQKNFPIFPLENSFTPQLFHFFTLPLFEPSLKQRI